MSENVRFQVEGLNRRTLVAGSVSLLAMPSVFSAALAATSAINVGVIMPLSGANTQFGINSRNGIEL
jgi:branched-chain amino acid transport system substrate-binding protein